MRRDPTLRTTANHAAWRWHRRRFRCGRSVVVGSGPDAPGPFVLAASEAVGRSPWVSSAPCPRSSAQPGSPSARARAPMRVAPARHSTTRFAPTRSGVGSPLRMRFSPGRGSRSRRAWTSRGNAAAFSSESRSSVAGRRSRLAATAPGAASRSARAEPQLRGPMLPGDVVAEHVRDSLQEPLASYRPWPWWLRQPGRQRLDQCLQAVVHDPRLSTHAITNGRIITPVTPDQNISSRSRYELSGRV